MLRIALAGSLAAGTCLAQPLAGPKVGDQRREGLVQRDYQGKVKVLDSTPEEAALELIELSPEARAAAFKVIAERAATLDRLVLENIGTLIALGTASAADNKADQFRLLLELAEKFRPLTERGPLKRQMLAVLPAEHRPRFAALVDEYWRAVVADARIASGGNNKLGALVGSRLGALGGEIERSFQRIQGSIVERYIRDITDKLALSERQQKTLAPIIRELADAFVREAPEPEVQRLALRLTAFLTEGQRTSLVEVINGRRPVVMPMTTPNEAKPDVPSMK